jgi:hypothetical protein
MDTDAIGGASKDLVYPVPSYFEIQAQLLAKTMDYCFSFDFFSVRAVT